MGRPSSVASALGTPGADVGPAQAWPVAPERWMKGFHGAVQGSGFLQAGDLSPRHMAMSRRSLGIQRMATLTELREPVAQVAVAPAAPEPQRFGTDRYAAPEVVGTGQRASPDDIAASVLGRMDTDQPAEERAAGGATAPHRKLPESIRWDRLEPLTDYIDRRLTEATILLLPNRSRVYAVVTRLIDIIGSLVLLALTSPVLLILVVVIRRDSPGPAIFRQTRVTGGGRTFQFYKFRTMWVDANERFPELYAYDFADDELDRIYYKLSDDPRSTPVGRWLRRTTLDELPNLFNVLKGDLSLVGPRPELPELVQYYRPEELACFFTKAGLTGLAQVAGRSLLTIRQRLTLDRRYVSQQTLLLDQRILWRTAVVVLSRRGAF